MHILLVDLITYTLNIKRQTDHMHSDCLYGYVGPHKFYIYGLKLCTGYLSLSNPIYGNIGAHKIESAVLVASRWMF